MEWLKDIKVVIFDLDGTLYQDYTFLGRYMKHMLNGQIEDDELQDNITEAYAILKGNHPVKLGHFFNRKNHKIYAQNDLRPTSCFSWDGKESEEVLEKDEHLLYIGDPWCIAAVYGEKHNITEKKRMEAFEIVRQEMLQVPYEIHRHHPLFEMIEGLAVEKKILMTNTPGLSGPEFIKHLKLERMFDEYFYDAKKPMGIQRVVERLLAEGYQPHQILSVGDNPFNDLYPVKKAGGKACLISQYSHDDSMIWDASVQTIEELTRFLKRLQGVHQ